jgi:flagella basal body P-ring formation protein FlgA
MTPRVVLILTIAFAAVRADAGALVALRPNASVTEGLVTLGEVADVRGSDPATSQKLSTIILGPGPDAGRETTITFETVRSRLMAAGVDLADVEFSGSSSVAVRGDSNVAVPMPDRTPRSASHDVRGRAERAVAAAVRRYLATKLGAGSLAVTPQVPEGEMGAVAAAEAHGFEVTGGTEPWTGSQTFTLRFLDAAEKVRQVQVACVVSQRPSVLAARYALPKGHVLGPDDLVWKKAETDTDATCATDPAQLLGHETQRPVRAGHPIPRDAVRSVPLVRNGQFVTVTSRRPGVAVQRVMKAKADGAAGETVPLLTLEDHKTVLARVTGLTEAETIDPATAASQPSMTHEPPADQGTIIPAEYQPALPAASRQTAADAPRVFVNPSQPLSVPAGPVGE